MENKFLNFTIFDFLERFPTDGCEDKNEIIL